MEEIGITDQWSPIAGYLYYKHTNVFVVYFIYILVYLFFTSAELGLNFYENNVSKMKYLI